MAARSKAAAAPEAELDLTAPAAESYTAADIEVLEALEPVRRRPGMYIGGTDERALHHLAAELLDNAMDEAVAGHASRIEFHLAADGSLSVGDNGRGIPVDPHPKFRDKSALEVILTTLHSGGKFGGDAYRTAGGLHGVGLSVVNALSEFLAVEVARGRRLFAQSYARGAPTSPLREVGAAANRRGTRIRFKPDAEIFGQGAAFRPERLYQMARSKAYLFGGVEIRWSCEAGLAGAAEVPAEEVLHFPGGLAEYLVSALSGRQTLSALPFAGRADLAEGRGAVEWAVAWSEEGEGFLRSYCNTVPTPLGGSHEAGLRAALTKGLRAYGEMIGLRKAAAQITAEDVFEGAGALLSLFLREPSFQGQTKEKLASPEATRLVEAALRDHFDHWLSAAPEMARALIEGVIGRAEARLARRQAREIGRKSATRRLRLPGKLADCAREAAEGTEIFLVEGDSAGGSAKQARDRMTQAVLPLRGKILNVASAAAGRLQANQELSDLVLALGCGSGPRFRLDDLRYEKVIIMTDADVDGAHIASLLMTFFHREMPGLIAAGRLYLAQPPLYRLSRGGTTLYARDDAHRDELLRRAFKDSGKSSGKGAGKVEISRFKGLGEMPAAQLKETTMNPARRSLLRVEASAEADARVEQLMGRRPERRFAFLQENATFADLDL